MSFDHLRRMAYKDYNVYKNLASKWDDEYLDLACYHLQQAIEKQLKAAIEFCGESYTHTHNITGLYQKYIDCGFAEIEDIELMGGTITEWEISGRYETANGFVATMRQIQRADSAFLLLKNELDLAIAKELTPGSSAETENDLEGK